MKDKIKKFLEVYAISFKYMNDQSFDAWVALAEDNKSNNGWCHIELRSWESIDGQTKILDLGE